MAADAVADLTGRRLRTWWWLVPTLVDVVLAAVDPWGHSAWHLFAATAIVIITPAARGGRTPD